MRSLPFLCLVLFLQLVPAVEVVATVTRHTDGDTLRVRIDGVDGTLAVRLLWLDTAESRNNDHGKAMPEGLAASAALATLVPVGAEVRLWHASPILPPDTYGRLLAVLVLPNAPETWQQDAATWTAQGHMITAGHSPYWRKYGEAQAPLHAAFLVGHETAKDGSAGAWGTAGKWMRDKSNERTAKGSRTP